MFEKVFEKAVVKAIWKMNVEDVTFSETKYRVLYTVDQAICRISCSAYMMCIARCPGCITTIIAFLLANLIPERFWTSCRRICEQAKRQMRKKEAHY